MGSLIDAMNYPVKRDLSFSKIIVYNIKLCFI